MKKLFTLAAALLLMGSLSAQQYSLVKVTEVKDGGLYVIERNDHVLCSTLSNKALQATDDYQTTALTGKEGYVWKLEGDNSEGFAIRNEKKYADDPTGHIYLSNTKSGGTEIKLSNEIAARWKFTFDGDEATITNVANADRFLGETSEGSNGYKAYAQSNIDTYGHNFTVYELQVSTAPFINVTPAAADFGTKAVGDKAVSMEITVSFGNLKGEITYTALASPFSVSGSLAESGDKLTITANPATEGKYSQTLTIKSEADNVSAQVKVTMNVADISGGFVKMTGDIKEGDYVITSDENALKASVSEKKRFDYEVVSIAGDVLADPDASVIWHIARSGDYWTLYNESTKKYAGSTADKNQGALLDDAESDNAKWNITVTDENTYEFENIARSEAAEDKKPDNKWLRNNIQDGTNFGFACYSASTGKPLTLYRLGATPTAVDQVEAEVKVVKVVEEGRIVIIRDGIRYNAQGVRLQ